MKVIDGFIFNDELDLLELRLMELGELVDEFVLVEMGHNFKQQPKPLVFEANQARFDKWKHKIRHIVPTNYKIGPHPILEHHQRKAIAKGFSGSDPHDILIIGDVDEIPSREVIENARRLPPDHPFTCVQRLYYYYVNCEQFSMWPGTVIGPKFVLGGFDCQKIRNDRSKFPRLLNAGWHFSWLGPLDSIQNKLNCIDSTADAKLYCTPEFNEPSPADTVFLERCMETGEDLFGRTENYAKKQFVPIEPGVRQPYSITEWLEKYPQYMRKHELTEVN